MADEQEVKNQQDASAGEKQSDEKGTVATQDELSYEDVVLHKDEYRQLMQELMESKIKLRDLEAAAKMQELRSSAPKSTQPYPPSHEDRRGHVDLDALPRDQFARLIVDTVNKHVGEQMIQPLVELVMTLSLKDEIRETASKYPDFFDYKDEIQEAAIKNPSLSIEDHYLLIKQRNPKRKSPPEVPEVKTLRALVHSGEKGGVSRQTVREMKTLDIRSAAEKAFGDLAKDFPE